MAKDVRAMRSNFNNSLQLAPSYWAALFQDHWSFSGGVPEGFVDVECQYYPEEVELVVESSPVEASMALDQLEAALENF